MVMQSLCALLQPGEQHASKAQARTVAVITNLPSCHHWDTSQRVQRQSPGSGPTTQAPILGPPWPGCDFWVCFPCYRVSAVIRGTVYQNPTKSRRSRNITNLTKLEPSVSTRRFDFQEENGKTATTLGVWSQVKAPPSRWDTIQPASPSPSEEVTSNDTTTSLETTSLVFWPNSSTESIPNYLKPGTSWTRCPSTLCGKLRVRTSTHS